MAVGGKVKTSLLLRWEGEHLATSDVALARVGTSIYSLPFVCFSVFFFQTKGSENKEKNCLGLYSYPVLMAADILLYR